MEKNHENNEMTLEKLATLTQQGFLEFDRRIDKLETRMDNFENELIGLKNNILEGFDKILKKLENLDEQNTLGFASYKRHDEKLINHESRLVSLESK